MMQCIREGHDESPFVSLQCRREAVYKGYCRSCAWVMLPDERELLPEKVKKMRKPNSDFSTSPPKKQKPKRDEAHLQMACCRLLKTLPGTLYFHVPSSFYKGANAGPGFFGYIARLKSMGWYAGISDLTIIFKNTHGATTVCFAELKVGYGTTSDAQDAFLDRANGLGCYTAKVKSLDDLLALLRAAGHGSVAQADS